MMVLNEAKYAQDLILGNRDDVKSIRQQIGLITRYNHHVLRLDGDANYAATVSWLEQRHDIFSEHGYSNIISDYVKKASKKPFYNIDSVNITKSEMDVITSQNNLRYEKILFVLLCMAKIQMVSHGFDNGLVSYSLTELFKTARVSVPVDEREHILHELLKAGLIGLPMKNDTRCLFVRFIDDFNDDVVLKINEQDCGELAYTYLNFTGKAKVSRCKKCGKLIKQSKKFGDLCKGCQALPEDVQIIQCEDCGKLVQVSIFNSKTCRCEECQHLQDQNKTRLRVQKHRELNQ